MVVVDIDAVYREVAGWYINLEDTHFPPPCLILLTSRCLLSEIVTLRDGRSQACSFRACANSCMVSLQRCRFFC